jgi:hypothetical protein
VVKEHQNDAYFAVGLLNTISAMPDRSGADGEPILGGYYGAVCVSAYSTGTGSVSSMATQILSTSELTGDKPFLQALAANPVAAQSLVSALSPDEIQGWADASQSEYGDNSPFEQVAEVVVNENWQAYANLNAYLGNLTTQQLSALLYAATVDHQGGLIALGNSAKNWFRLHGGHPVSSDPEAVSAWVAQLGNMLGAACAPSGGYYNAIGNLVQAGYIVADGLIQVAGVLLGAAAIDVVDDWVGLDDLADVAESVFSSALTAARTMEAFEVAWNGTESVTEGVKLIKLAVAIYGAEGAINQGLAGVNQIVAAQQNLSDGQQYALTLYFIIVASAAKYADYVLLEDGYVVGTNGRVVTPAGSTQAAEAQATGLSQHADRYFIQIPGGQWKAKERTPLSVVFASVLAQFEATQKN